MQPRPQTRLHPCPRTSPMPGICAWPTVPTAGMRGWREIRHRPSRCVVLDHAKPFRRRNVIARMNHVGVVPHTLSRKPLSYCQGWSSTMQPGIAGADTAHTGTVRQTIRNAPVRLRESQVASDAVSASGARRLSVKQATGCRPAKTDGRSPLRGSAPRAAVRTASED